jgi:hypothetical protein
MNWLIVNLERSVLLNDGVIVAHWRCEGVDGEFSASAYGSCGFTPDPEAEDFVPFDQLTEADVLAWVWGVEDKDDIESKVQAKIDEQKAPSTEVGVPW